MFVGRAVVKQFTATTKALLVGEDRRFVNAWGVASGTLGQGVIIPKGSVGQVRELAHAYKRQSRFTAVGHDARWFSVKVEGSYTRYFHEDDMISYNGNMPTSVGEFFDTL